MRHGEILNLTPNQPKFASPQASGKYKPEPREERLWENKRPGVEAICFQLTLVKTFPQFSHSVMLGKVHLLEKVTKQRHYDLELLKQNKRVDFCVSLQI